MDPRPIPPITIRLLGAMVPFLPSAEPGMMYGTAKIPSVVPAAFLINCLLLFFIFW
jgi:hypothetical protein